MTKLDRLGRSLEHLIDLSKSLQSRGVDLVVLDQGIDKRNVNLPEASAAGTVILSRSFKLQSPPTTCQAR